MNQRTLLLKSRDIQRLITVKDAVKAVESAFTEAGRGHAQMPAKIYLDLPKYRGDFRAMPAYLEKSGSCVLKWVNAHPQNTKAGLPAVMAVLILNDPKTGFPLSIMDGTLLTALRTGAAGAVAAKYLARKNSKVVGLIGCGIQARAQLESILPFFKIKEVKVWGHEKKLIRDFIKKKKYKSIRLIAADLETCARESDILITTTPVRKPIVKAAWISPGTHINAIGADAQGKQELETKLLKQATIVIDDWEQASHSGEINIPLKRKQITKRKIHAELGSVVARKKKGRRNSKEITIFDSTGLAIQDAAVAQHIYKKAIRNKVGSKIRLF